MATVGFVTTSFPRWAGDPAGSFVLGLGRALVARGHLVEVVVPAAPGRDEWSGKADWRAGIDVFPARYAHPRRLQLLFFGAGAPDNLRRAPWLSALAPAAAASMLARSRQRAARWDAVVSHWLLPSALIGGLARRRGSSHLAVAHSADVHLLGRAPFGRALTAAVLRSADRVGVVAEQLGRDLCEIAGPGLGPELRGALAVAPMGVDPGELAPPAPRARLRSSLGLDRWTVLFLGRLVPVKGVDVLIEAVGALEETELLVAGEGPARPELEALALAHGVRARFVGSVDPRGRAELLAACDALALPSRVLPDGRHEGLPLVLLEAMTAGLPVVASDTGGVGELVTPATGIRVPPEDAGALAAALGALHRGPALAARLAAAGRRAAADRSWDELAPRYEGLLGIPPGRAPGRA